ncbi:hypothetical protein KCV87_27220 [Actinosynnema pretiosum subsp. pretiosum]|uniref:Uncharacterized protein n=2 Tax=Actinosynnema TaxID=40566 RepID=C6WDB8_ACTMD|nr:hypothetical protein [Actinosynnema mirum]ACU39555.1 hypothetical protein Amir_5741 [Actinosynnema mirum DSM 43827]AXX33061.1 hypothetical protein APASM_5696 [Actinosynnema pretiosum subsp. pretiosum]QUF03085.1 hypothetical protein KCV87_27220 [Actinosynnema pretiosum subsp. pretiosum]
MGKGARRRRRQRQGQRARDEALLARRSAGPVVRERSWFERLSTGKQVWLVLGAIPLAVLGHYALWSHVVPLVGEVVAPVPVVSTVVGWLFGGAAFGVGGIALLVGLSDDPGRARAWRRATWVSGSVAVLMAPVSEWSDVPLPVDYFGGVFAGAWGVLLAPLALGVVALVAAVTARFSARARAFGAGDGGNRLPAWLLIGYSLLLLVWGSTLLRQ